MKSNYKKLGNYIEACDCLNTSGEITLLQGISNEKYFQECKSNKNGIDLCRYRICEKGWFAYNRATTRNGEKISIAYREEETCIVSPSYKCFRIIDEQKLDPKYLLLWFNRNEFDRYARYKSHGSAHEYFEFNEMCDVEIPVPPIEKQRSIVKAYKTITDRITLKKRINDNLEAQMRAYFKEYIANNTAATGKLKDYSVMQYGYTETATTEPVGPKFLRITDIAQSYIDWNGVPYCPITKENHKKYVLSEGDVVVARTGATVGYAKMMGKTIPNSVFASFLVRIRPINDEYKYYFGLTITSAEFLEFVQTNAGGSAQPQANPPLLGEYELSIPDKQSLAEFNAKIVAFLSVIECSEAEISKLNEVRDTMVTLLSRR